MVGCSGSGKTTLARSLAGALGVPHIELDAIFHQPGWTPLDDDTFRTRVTEATTPDRWVVDGNYSTVRDMVWERADTVVWFDLSFARTMARVIRRTVRRTVLRRELWNGNREPLSNLLSFDPKQSIIAWAASRHHTYRGRYTAAQADPRWRALTFIRLPTPAAVRRLVADVEATERQAS